MPAGNKPQEHGSALSTIQEKNKNTKLMTATPAVFQKELLNLCTYTLCTKMQAWLWSYLFTPQGQIHAYGKFGVLFEFVTLN